MHVECLVLNGIDTRLRDSEKSNSLGGVEIPFVCLVLLLRMMGK